MKAKTFNEISEEDIRKYNPYHDSKGRFTTRGGMSYFSPGRDPAQAARSIAREKEIGNTENWNGYPLNTGYDRTATSVKEAEMAIYRAKYAEIVDLEGVNNLAASNEVVDQLKHLQQVYPTEDQLLMITAQDLRPGVNAQSNFERLTYNKSFLNHPHTVYQTTEQYHKAIDSFIQQQKVMMRSDRAHEAQYKERIAKAESDREFPRHNVRYKGLEARCTTTHEYGHILADQIFRQINHSSLDLFKPIRESEANEMERRRNLVRDTFKKAQANKDILKISAYANSNEYEFFAEAFAMKVMQVEKLPTYIDRMIDDVLS